MTGKVFAGIIIVALGLFIVAAKISKSAEGPQPKTDDEKMLSQLSGYQQWALVNPSPVRMDRQTSALCGRPLPNSDPHSSKFISVYVNSLGRDSMMKSLEPEFPVGSIIVKEKLSSETATTPELLTVMVKRESGYNRDSGDWEYLILDGMASKITARGKLEKCNACHVLDKNSDYVSRAYLPLEIRKGLK